MVYQASSWDALPRFGDGTNASDDESLARRLQEEEFENPSMPYTVNLIKVVCVGDWATLPLELKQHVLQHIVKEEREITAEDFQEGQNWIISTAPRRVKQDLPQPAQPTQSERSWILYDFRHYIRVSKGFRDDVEQYLYQHNRIRLQPEPIRVAEEEATPKQTRCKTEPLRKVEKDEPRQLCLFYPPQRVNHFISRLDFHNPDLIQVQADPRKWIDDTWQFLKNIALGAYGFPELRRIRVFFPPEPWRMQVFWAWNIKIKGMDGYEVFCPEEKFWQHNLEMALMIRPDELTESDEPGFELIKRQSS